MIPVSLKAAPHAPVRFMELADLVLGPRNHLKLFDPPYLKPSHLACVSPLRFMLCCFLFDLFLEDGAKEAHICVLPIRLPILDPMPRAERLLELGRRIFFGERHMAIATPGQRDTNKPAKGKRARPMLNFEFCERRTTLGTYRT